MDVNKIKRQSTLNESLEINGKKLRTVPHEQKSMTSIENLSNEIFYEIFDYLDGYDICNAFSDLNFRIQQLITSSSCRLKLTFRKQSNSEIKHYCTHVMFPKRQQIMSLIFWNISLIDEVFKHCVIDSLFDRLESIRIREISFEKLITYLYYFKALPRLFSLSICSKDENFYDLGELYRMIFCLPFLKYNHLIIFEATDINSLVPMAINTRFSSIDYLVMDHTCTLTELISMLYHTPQLRHLICGTLVEFNDNFDIDVVLTLPHLTHIKINECVVEFDDFEKLLKQICGQLQVFRIDKWQNMEFTYPDRWQQFILQNMPHLLHFNISQDLRVDGIFEDFHIEKYINQVTSSCWIDHGWILELFIYSEEMGCRISPYKKSWFNDNQYTVTINHSHQDISSKQQTADKSCIQFRKNIELNFISRNGLNWNPTLMNKLHPMLPTIQVNSLCIDTNQMPISTFLTLIHLLPNLDLLKVISLPLQQPNELSNEDAENLRSASKCNKITKVSQNMDMDLTAFLITLCPRIEHLEIIVINDIDVKRFMRFILIKISTHSPCLHSFLMYYRKMNDKIVDKLQKMIDSEHLLSNYKIKRWDKEITLKWR